MERSTNTLLPAEQISPWFQKMPLQVPSMACSNPASANTMFGDFPPSSRVTRLRVSAPDFRTVRPTSTDPVNPTLSTWGLSTSGAPAVGPNPVMTLNAPDGCPLLRRHQDRVVPGSDEAGHTNRLLDHEAHGVGADRRHLPHDLGDPPAVVLEDERGLGHVLFRLRQGLAGVAD